MRIIIMASLALGLLAGILAPLVSELHVYRATSGYSGKQFWLSFASEPDEDAMLDAVIYREPMIADKYQTTESWRGARNNGVNLFIKRDSDVSIVVMPYSATADPDITFADGGRVKGVWLTEPATRLKMPVALVGVMYFVGWFLAISIITFCALTVVRWLWYFMLRRISELVRAVKKAP